MIIYPLRISEMDKREDEGNLLLLEDKHYICQGFYPSKD